MTTYHVRPKVGSDRNAGDSFDAALQTLSMALRRYEPGDTIHIWGGRHPPVTITRDRLTLVGHGAQISGALRPGAQHGILIRASYVSILGLDVRGARGAGIAATGAHHITLRGNRVVGNGGHGISLIAGDYYVVDGNEIVGNIGSAERVVSRTSGISIFNPTPFDGGEDVAWRIKVTNNVIRGNGTTAKTDGFGIILDKFYRETPTPYFAQTLVADNLITGNWNSGLFIYYTDNVDVLRNQLIANGQDQTKKWAAELGVQFARNIRVRSNYARAGRSVFFSGGAERNDVTFTSNDFGPVERIASPYSGAGQPGP